MKLDKNLKSFFSDSIIYTVLNVLMRGIPFLLLPIIVRIVSVAEYGKYSIFVSTESLLIPLIGFNLHGAVNRHYYEKDNINFPAYISTVITTQLLGILFFILVYLLFSIRADEIFGLSANLFQLAIFSAGGMVIINVITTLFRAQRKPNSYGLFVLSQALLLFGTVLLFVQYFPDANGIAIARVLIFAVFAFCSLYLLNYNGWLKELKIDRVLLKRAMTFALPTIPHALSAFVFVYSDRFIIQYYLGEEQVGFYSGIFQLSALLSVLAVSFNAAWIPWIFENLKKNEDRILNLIVKVSWGLKLGFLIVGSCFLIIFPLISNLILSTPYQSNNYLSYYFVAGFLFQAFYFIVAPYIFFIEKTKYLGILSMLAATVNILLNIFLIPSIGVKGAAVATCISWGVLYFGTFMISSRLYKMPWI